MRPPFIRVLPDEAERYGPAAAIVLAHIRFRCESEGPGRIDRDGLRWWRVSRHNLGREVGLSVKVVRKALDGLSGVVAAKHFAPLSDQSLAYRPVVDDDALNCQKPRRASAHQPEAPQGTDRAPMGISKSPAGHGTEPHRASALPIRELEEEQEGGEAGVRAPGPLDVEFVSDSANAPSLQSESLHPTDPAGPGEVFDAEVVIEPESNVDPEPPLFCDLHPNDTDGPCGPCASRRRAHDRWERRHPPKSKIRAWQELVQEIRATEERAPAPAPKAIAAAKPPRPTPPEWVPGPTGEPRCRRHGHLPSMPPHCAGCRAAEIAAGESPYRAMKAPARQKPSEGKQ